jgi:hypothetical protein
MCSRGWRGTGYSGLGAGLGLRSRSPATAAGHVQAAAANPKAPERLGLASLASQRVRVESLFIDEGFGSLDADTLNTAMEALDRLQSQGRRVGVISHVAEMAERIGVQVRVRPTGAGRSVVEVDG